MANSLTTVFLIILSSRFAFGGRTNIIPSHSRHSVSPLALADDAGSCALRIEIYGYACEEHTVTTQDGYILSMQRIPTGRSGTTVGNKPPVLLQHGLLMDGITWLLNSPDESLAFILADNGFDVWIANTRGTKYSRGHTSLSTDDRAYWEWSWDELAAYELPANVQYVHDQTSQKIHYVGHSLGTLVAFAAFSQEKLLDLISSAALLSPIAHLGQVTSTIGRDGAKAYIAENLYSSGVYEFSLKGPEISKILKGVCDKSDINCFNLMTSFTGKNCCLNSSNINVFLENEPQSSSTKTMIHIAQMIRDSTITKFNYGDDNMKHYGQTNPPAYDMTSIPANFPLFLSYGGADALSDTNDVQSLLGDLNDHDGDKLVVQYQEDYAHADFVMAVNAKQIVYDPLMAFFKLQ